LSLKEESLPMNANQNEGMKDLGKLTLSEMEDLPAGNGSDADSKWPRAQSKAMRALIHPLRVANSVERAWCRMAFLLNHQKLCGLAHRELIALALTSCSGYRRRLRCSIQSRARPDQCQANRA